MATRRQALLTLALPAGALLTPWLRAQALLELNSASRAQLEALPGLGPQLVDRLLLARQQAPFSSWSDLQRRVRGIGPRLAARLSAAGLRIEGQALPG